MAKASTAEEAARVFIPKLASISAIIMRLVALSSTTSTNLPARLVSSPGDALSAPSATLNLASNWNVLPLPDTLSTVNLPFIFSTRRRQIPNPRPLPPKRRVVELSACVKSSNISPSLSAGMPMPVSLKANRICPGWPSSCGPMRSSTRPLMVNFTALLTRLLRICCRRTGSPTKQGGVPGANCISTEMFFRRARGKASSITRSTSSRRSNSIASSSNRPASIFDKSRMSFIKVRRLEPARLKRAT